MFSIPGKTIG